jgi:hypothetical protein
MRENIFEFFDKIILSFAIRRSLKQKVQYITTSEKLIQLLETDYSQAFEKAKEDFIIYRGTIDYGKENLAVIAEPSERINETHYDIYVRLFSGILKSWKNFPRRTHATFGSFDKKVSSEYGKKLYVVLPKNDEKIALSNYTDVWDSFQKVGEIFNDNSITLLDLDTYLAQLFSNLLNMSLNEVESFFKNESDEKILQFFDTINDKLKELYEKYKNGITIKQLVNNSDKNFDIPRKFIYNFFEFYKLTRNFDFLAFLDSYKLLNSQSFYTFPINSAVKNINHDSEVWFEGPALYILEKDFIKLLKNKNKFIQNFLNDKEPKKEKIIEKEQKKEKTKIIEKEQNKIPNNYKESVFTNISEKFFDIINKVLYGQDSKTFKDFDAFCRQNLNARALNLSLKDLDTIKVEELSQKVKKIIKSLKNIDLNDEMSKYIAKYLKNSNKYGFNLTKMIESKAEF